MLRRLQACTGFFTLLDLPLLGKTQHRLMYFYAVQNDIYTFCFDYETRYDVIVHCAGPSFVTINYTLKEHFFFWSYSLRYFNLKVTQLLTG